MMGVHRRGGADEHAAPHERDADDDGGGEFAAPAWFDGGWPDAPRPASGWAVDHRARAFLVVVAVIAVVTVAALAAQATHHAGGQRARQTTVPTSTDVRGAAEPTPAS